MGSGGSAASAGGRPRPPRHTHTHTYTHTHTHIQVPSTHTPRFVAELPLTPTHPPVLRPLRFGRGTGGQSWSGMGWPGFVRSEFRPPDKRPSIFFFRSGFAGTGRPGCVRSAASKGQICPVTGLCEVPCYPPASARHPSRGRVGCGSHPGRPWVSGFQFIPETRNPQTMKPTQVVGGSEAAVIPVGLGFCFGSPQKP